MRNSPCITVGHHKIGDFCQPYILAEMACSHEGKPEFAHRLVDIAADANVNGIQVQILSVKNVVAPYHRVYELGLKLEIPKRDWLEIIEHAKERGLQVWVNVFDESGVEFARDPQVDAIKIHSSDLSNLDMLEKVSSIGKPVSLSTGGSTLDEIAQAVFYLKDNGVNNLILMHGYQAYPTKINESNINYLKTLNRIFNCPVGYQDHTVGGSEFSFILPLTAFALGAVLLEKHITSDRSLKHTDYESALNPDELKRFVELANEMNDALDSGDLKPFSEDVINYRRNFKKSIVAARNIMKGEVFSKDMLIYLRADEGFPPSDMNKVVGRKSLQDLEKYTTLKQEHLGQK